MAIMDVTVNATRILNSIWMHPGISRIGLSRELNLNKSTITKIVSNLMAEGLVLLSETPDQTDNKGRRPTGLFFNTELGVILGIEIQTDSWNGVAVDPSGKVVDSFSSTFLPSNSQLIPIVDEAISFGLARQEAAGRRILGVGLGLSGQINPYLGIILSSNPLNIHEPLDIHDYCFTRYPFPVVVENDANCCCWNVILEKKSLHPRNFLCVLAEQRRTGWGTEQDIADVKGVAVGLGLVIKDSVLHGDRFSAGEFQSVFKVQTNPTQFDLPTQELLTMYTDTEIWERTVQELSRNVALLVNVLNISLVKVFGNFVLDAPRFQSILYEEIQVNWPYDNEVQCGIEISANGSDSVAIGAAGYFLHRMFSMPDIWEGNESVYPEGIDLLRMALDSGFQGKRKRTNATKEPVMNT